MVNCKLFFAEDTAVQQGTSNTFTACVAALGGGAIGAVNSSLGNITANVFLSNQAGEHGGAVALSNTNATIQGNTFTQNVISSNANAADSAIFSTGGKVTNAAGNVYVPTQGGYQVQ